MDSTTVPVDLRQNIKNLTVQTNLKELRSRNFIEMEGIDKEV